MGLLEQIKNRGLVLDGAMSYELEKQGVDNNNKFADCKINLNTL
ncbi:MAG: hypothetical protein QP756_08660 [Lactobacillus crispatus]|nr:hypothetical protein [Lactobacillus crispatus]MDK7321143.1 hypothetical protein [Lactobacillus crispatus]MDK8273429.1 hypothetical protein [Lactobacillus crispatus]MDK8569569.1 hypothetical protein [Lactobacillus crispatus]